MLSCCIILVLCTISKRPHTVPEVNTGYVLDSTSPKKSSFTCITGANINPIYTSTIVLLAKI